MSVHGPARAASMFDECVYLVVFGGGEGGAAVTARGLVFRRDRQIREVDSEGKLHRSAKVVAREGVLLEKVVVEGDPGHGARGLFFGEKYSLR